jgi:hypothetical protein
MGRELRDSRGGKNVLRERAWSMSAATNVSAAAIAK